MLHMKFKETLGRTSGMLKEIHEYLEFIWKEPLVNMRAIGNPLVYLKQQQIFDPQTFV